jgi:hypothetical protein
MVMIENQAIIEKQIFLESRLARVEASTVHIQDDIKEIKNSLRWLTGIIFSINSATLGVVTKGFGLF